MNVQHLTEQINHRADQIRTIQDSDTWFDAHMRASAEAERALSQSAESDLTAITEGQEKGTAAATAARAVLGELYYGQAKAMGVRQILDELAPLTDYRDPLAGLYRAEGYREEITAAEALRREALVSVLVSRYRAAANTAEGEAETGGPERDQAAAVCKAVERQLSA